LRRQRWEFLGFGFWLLDYQWTLLDNNGIGVCAFWALPLLFTLLLEDSRGDIILEDVIFLMLHHHRLLFLGYGGVSPPADFVRLGPWSYCLHLIVPLRGSRATLELGVLRGGGFLVNLLACEVVGRWRDCGVAHFCGRWVAIRLVLKEMHGILRWLRSFWLLRIERGTGGEREGR
jgi:hypothetical protein